MAEHDIRRSTVQELLARLGSADAAPGGGAAGALAGAIGASLVRMLALLTVGRPAYAAHEELMRAIAEQAGEEHDRLLDLARDDATAYDAVLAALALPQASPEEQAARRAAREEAFKAACEVPLRVMERSLEVIGLAKTAVQHGNRNAASDGAAGSELARAAMRIAGWNIRVNLGSIEDEAYARQMRTRMDEIEYMGGTAASEIDSRVSDLWRPAPSRLGS